MSCEVKDGAFAGVEEGRILELRDSMAHGVERGGMAVLVGGGENLS